MSLTFYNENDPKTAAWLRELTRAGHLQPGHIDARSIELVRSEDLQSFGQCHFFAGIGGWPLALKLAGWPDDLPVWTGSCPCQPFSCAGKQAGASDKRHLWPEFKRLIDERRPPIIFGEQVASKLGREWLAGVRSDLEALGYAVGAADLCAASAGAPHIRQRLYWVAFSGHERRSRVLRESRSGSSPHSEPSCNSNIGSGNACGLANSVISNVIVGSQTLWEAEPPGRSSIGRLANGISTGLEIGNIESTRKECQTTERNCTDFWNNFDLIPCADGKARRVESGTFPLAHGVPGRVGLLRGYGNAIIPQLAAVFIKASLEALANPEPSP